MSSTLLLVIVAGLLAVLYGAVQSSALLRASPGNARMQEIAAAIQEGAQAYLRREYQIVAIVAVVVAVLLAILINWETALGFLVGAIASGLAGFIGMSVAVRANVRTAEAGRSGLAPALSTAFRGGTVTGLLVVGLGLGAVTVFYAIFEDVDALVGLAFGGSASRRLRPPRRAEAAHRPRRRCRPRPRRSLSSSRSSDRRSPSSGPGTRKRGA